MTTPTATATPTAFDLARQLARALGVEHGQVTLVVAWGEVEEIRPMPVYRRGKGETKGKKAEKKGGGL